MSDDYETTYRGMWPSDGLNAQVRGGLAALRRAEPRVGRGLACFDREGERTKVTVRAESGGRWFEAVRRSREGAAVEAAVASAFEQLEEAMKAARLMRRSA